jgi:hypothetical protein
MTPPDWNSFDLQMQLMRRYYNLRTQPKSRGHQWKSAHEQLEHLHAMAGEAMTLCGQLLNIMDELKKQVDDRFKTTV